MTIKKGPPRYDLAVAQRGAVEIPRTCLEKADEFLLLDNPNPDRVRRHVKALFLSLTPEDYAHTEIMPRRGGQAWQGDVYGKVDEHGLWFIKFRVEGATVIMSCHEAEHDLVLLNGRKLRRQA